jgi:fatty-acyl-CoA synthase
MNGGASANGPREIVGRARSSSRLFIGSILEFLERQVAKLWLLDDVIFVDALPVGATGEVQKSELREGYAGWRGHAHA